MVVGWEVDPDCVHCARTGYCDDHAHGYELRISTTPDLRTTALALARRRPRNSSHERRPTDTSLTLTLTAMLISTSSAFKLSSNRQGPLLMVINSVKLTPKMPHILRVLRLDQSAQILVAGLPFWSCSRELSYVALYGDCAAGIGAAVRSCKLLLLLMCSLLLLSSLLFLLALLSEGECYGWSAVVGA